MILQTPSDVARELLRNPLTEYDLKPSQGPTVRLYATSSGSFVVWPAPSPRPATGLVNLTELELGKGPYLLKKP